jgi:hypothetical protein
VSTVNVETAELEVFDSHAYDITVDHILASGSLPAAFPWTNIQGKHYWDAGIISNSPLELVLERCGETSKRVFVVDLFPRQQRLPENLAEVLMRRDEIVYAERVRNDVRVKERIGDFRSLVQEIMDNLEPEACQRLRQSPRFIQLMAEAAPTTITDCQRVGGGRITVHGHRLLRAQHRAAQTGRLSDGKTCPWPKGAGLLNSTVITRMRWPGWLHVSASIVRSDVGTVRRQKEREGGGSGIGQSKSFGRSI